MNCGAKIQENMERVISIETSKAGSFQDIFTVIEREQQRARQQRSHLSLVVFALGKTVDGYTFAAHVLWKILARSSYFSAAGWFDEHHIGVVMPDTSPERSRNFAENIRMEIPPKVCLEYVIFTYPDVWLNDFHEHFRQTETNSGQIRPFRSLPGESSRPAARMLPFMMRWSKK